MLFTLLSWGIIFISAFMWGYVVLHFVAKAVRYRKWTLDLTLTAGLCALAVYAQLFSLFYKVGVLAFALMLLADAVLLLFMRRDMIIWWKERVLGRYVRHELVMIFILGVFALIMSSASVKQGRGLGIYIIVWLITAPFFVSRPSLA